MSKPTESRGNGSTVGTRVRLAGLAAIALSMASVAPAAGQWTLPDGAELGVTYQYETRQPVSPFFEGWYANPDGTYTLSFGYFNRNLDETVEIPIGPNNFIEPTEYNGHQPTAFLAQPDYSIPGREWGVFTVVVPADFVDPGDDVVWTLTSSGGTTHSVPGRVGNVAYQLPTLEQPMGLGTLPPLLRLESQDLEAVGQTGWIADEVTTRVGEPVNFTVWAQDRKVGDEREPEDVGIKWFKHQGPVGGEVTFSDEGEGEVPAAGGEASFQVLFGAPGDYVIRVRADAFGASDSGDQRVCCWTNGYIPVSVEE